MEVKNLQIRKNNLKRFAKKMAISSTAIIIGSIIFKDFVTQHNFHEPVIHADNYSSINSELEEKYSINLEDNTLPCAEEIVSFIQDGQAFEENKSVENRINYVNSAKALAYAADDMIKEKIQAATGAKIEDITLPEKPDKSDGNYLSMIQVNNQSYNLPEEVMGLIMASNEITEYKGTGENEAWDNDINSFSYSANKLFDEVMKSNYSLKLNGQDLSVVPTIMTEAKEK